MPAFLRKVHKNRWSRESAPWIGQGDTQADAMTDLETRDNRLSVWRVDDEPGLEEVIAAMAANCDYLSVFDYVLFGQDAICQIGIKIESSLGSSGDQRINRESHHDLIELTAGKLAVLAGKGTPARRPKKEVLNLVNDAVRSGRIDEAALKENVRAEIRRGCTPGQ